MDKKRTLIAGGALALLVIAGGTGLAIASGGDDEQQLTGSALDQASAAALEHTGAGTVIEAEAGMTAPPTVSRSASTTAVSSTLLWMRTSAWSAGRPR